MSTAPYIAIYLCTSLQRILARIARFSRVQCLRLLLPRLKCHNNLDSTTRLKALHERKRYYRMKREQRERGRY